MRLSNGVVEGRGARPPPSKPPDLVVEGYERVSLCGRSGFQEAVETRPEREAGRLPPVRASDGVEKGKEARLPPSKPPDLVVKGCEGWSL